MFGVTLWEMFTYGQEPWIGLNGSQVKGLGVGSIGWVGVILPCFQPDLVGTDSFLTDSQYCVSWLL